MDRQEFMMKQQEAVERMKDAAKRSQFENRGNIPPAPSFVKINRNTQRQETENRENENNNEKKNSENKQNEKADSLFGFDLSQIPFLNNLKDDKDFTVILGLILILLSEKSDKLLLFALLYILL